MGGSDDYLAHVSAILSEVLSIQAPSQDTDLFEEGLLDSFGMVELLATLEQEFGITVSPEELEFENFRSVNAIAAFAARCASQDLVGTEPGKR